MGPKFSMIQRVTAACLFAEGVSCLYCGFLFPLGSLGRFGVGFFWFFFLRDFLWGDVVTLVSRHWCWNLI